MRSSIRALLTGLIDYAGLFPPASLTMADAVSRYARYRRGPHAWVLGRFIVPCARLAEFEAARDALLASAPAGAEAEPWRLSVLASSDVEADRVAIEAFNAHAAGRVCIDAVEAKVDSATDVGRIAAAFDGASHVWFEVAPGPAPALGSLLDAIASVGQRAGAKLRTGGVTPEVIPEADVVALFLLACTRAGVPCKATAGLHHPIRAPHRLTYADDSPTAPVHGFVNVFLAATLARVLMPYHRTDESIVAALADLVDERDPRRIEWHDDHVVWQGRERHRFGVPAITSTRERFARSFGSCSFDEPIADLKQLGWL